MQEMIAWCVFYAILNHVLSSFNDLLVEYYLIAHQF